MFLAEKEPVHKSLASWKIPMFFIVGPYCVYYMLKFFSLISNGLGGVRIASHLRVGWSKTGCRVGFVSKFPSTISYRCSENDSRVYWPNGCFELMKNPDRKKFHELDLRLSFRNYTEDFRRYQSFLIPPFCVFSILVSKVSLLRACFISADCISVNWQISTNFQLIFVSNQLEQRRQILKLLNDQILSETIKLVAILFKLSGNFAIIYFTDLATFCHLYHLSEKYSILPRKSKHCQTSK